MPRCALVPVLEGAPSRDRSPGAGLLPIVLEVSPRWTAAGRLYLREGHQQIDARQVPDPLTSRSLEYLRLAKMLDSPALRHSEAGRG